MSLKISEGLLAQSLTLLAECGDGREECVVIWVGPADAPGCVQRVVRPEHVARKGGYRIDGDWLNRFWDELANRHERIVAQVHTHPHRAFHSKRDDTYPILLTAGLYSVVIPNFAREPIDQSNWYLCRLGDGGVWQELDWLAEVAS